MATQDTFAIQLQDGKPQIHRDWTVDQFIQYVERADRKVGASLEATENRIAAIQKDVVGNPDIAVEYFMLKQAQSRTDELLNCDLDPLSSEHQRNRVDQYHLYSEVGSALLYRDLRFQGKSKFFTLTWPNFKWPPYKFNDAASSAKVWGAHIVFEHSWYRGRRLYLVGIPYAEFPDFRELDFNDIASSIAGLP
ncbi:MAG: hypothetical protein IGR93_15780 [Hydrococcus sp. C42_A2020_068]|uniref:hypothetical protein n=1 Tax=Pleurocapsa sp. PCC 7327 TaxID=118163 RepID=UPI00030693A7|nr:hypothetical protein [Pleurocapsa sp. PCC 7327]MBF2021513.1 hypothetical protein [Hydrococcus sp. C42_A2020_068]